jgi:ribosomal protein S27E
MMGRYGTDTLNRFLLGTAMFCLVLSLFRVPYVYYLSLALLIYSYYRMFSRNIQARYRENTWFLNHTAGARRWLMKEKNHLTQLKSYHIYKCPSCKQKIRVPRGRGRIEIRCRKCGETFIRKS